LGTPYFILSRIAPHETPELTDALVIARTKMNGAAEIILSS
jgi:hypothetical protein